MKKKKFYTELSYLIGMIVLALGTALMEKANLGMSMVVAPAYILHLKISQIVPFFSFGMAEYTFQALLIIIIMLVIRRFKVSYLFSFVTAVFYGFLLDGSIYLFSFISAESMLIKLILFISGMILCSMGVALLFKTYISPEAYELFVKVISEKYNLSIFKVKTCYDCISCLLGIVLSFSFFGLWHFEGVKIGTIVCALLNGWLIGKCSSFLGRFFKFEDCFKLRSFFVNDNSKK